MFNPDDDDKTYYISSDGQVHDSAHDAIEAGQANEAASGQYVTGGNCPQDADSVPDEK